MHLNKKNLTTPRSSITHRPAPPLAAPARQPRRTATTPRSAVTHQPAPNENASIINHLKQINNTLSSLQQLSIQYVTAKDIDAAAVRRAKQPQPLRRNTRLAAQQVLSDTLRESKSG